MSIESKNRVWYDAEHNLGRVYLGGKVTKEIALDMEMQYREVEKKHPKLNWLDDITHLENIDNQSLLIFLKIFKELKTSKIALVGDFTRTVSYVDFLLGFIKDRMNWKYFSDEKEAILWLKNDSLK